MTFLENSTFNFILFIASNYFGWNYHDALYHKRKEELTISLINDYVYGLNNYVQHTYIISFWHRCPSSYESTVSVLWLEKMDGQVPSKCQ